jgi:hypothetical protein
MSEQKKTGIVAFDEFCKLPDLRQRIKQARVIADDFDAERERDLADERIQDLTNGRAQDKAQHAREIDLMTKAQASVPIIAAHNVTKGDRRDSLDAVIDKAQQTATDPQNYQSVFAEMVKMASTSARPAPLHGPASITGIPYIKSNGDKEHFTTRALKGRLERRQKL